MKTYFIALVMLMSSTFIIAQHDEFQRYENNLIYSQSAISKLKKISDSLNLMFLQCEIDPIHFASEQALASRITIDNAHISQAIKDMNQHMNLDEFKVKYPDAQIEEHVLVVRSKYVSYDEKTTIYFKSWSLNGSEKTVSKFDSKFFTENLTGKWIYPDNNPTSKEQMIAYYFPKNFETPQLPEKYAKMIAYADCMIDTNTSKLLKNEKNANASLPQNWKSLTLIEQEKLLEEMRKTVVYGMCSQDSRPRYHAMHIAQLAAETQNWDVFLKAHLDIMNDNFQRMIDGSYAYGARKTYIQELEHLNINLMDLIFGISLTFKDPAEHHYFGDISRIGRALSESNDKESVEKAMIDAIEDSSLDLLNRIRIYFMFKHYISYHPINEQEKKQEKLEAAIAMLPYNLNETHKRWKVRD